MIVKLQRCLFPPDGPVLAYNKSRTVRHELALTRKEQKELFHGKLKVFREAELVGTILHIGKEVADPGW